MEETDGGAAPEETTLSGTPNPAPDADGGAYEQPAVMIGPKSSLPKIMGILMMLYGAGMGLLSVLALLMVGTTINDLELSGISVNTPFMYADAVVDVAFLFVVAYAGYQVFNYQKSGVMLALYAIGVDLVMGLIGALFVADMMAEIAGDSAFGSAMGGIGAFFSVFCAAICGLLVYLPVLASADSLED